MQWCMCFVFARAGLHKKGTSCVWPIGGSTPGYLLASSPVRVVESFPAQHSSERIRSSVADGSLGKISPLLLLVIMSGLSMGEGMVVWRVMAERQCVCV
jgi:hypothetical protein